MPSLREKEQRGARGFHNASIAPTWGRVDSGETALRSQADARTRTGDPFITREPKAVFRAPAASLGVSVSPANRWFSRRAAVSYPEHAWAVGCVLKVSRPASINVAALLPGPLPARSQGKAVAPRIRRTRAVALGLALTGLARRRLG
jgi:hypothetical protein